MCSTVVVRAKSGGRTYSDPKVSRTPLRAFEDDAPDPPDAKQGLFPLTTTTTTGPPKPSDRCSGV